jgi:SAM-dependent methyltransferase
MAVVILNVLIPNIRVEGVVRAVGSVVVLVVRAKRERARLISQTRESGNVSKEEFEALDDARFFCTALGTEPRTMHEVPDEKFDLILATNILIYYDLFEQSLAVANIAKMLRPGGFFLSNDPISELPTSPVKSVGATEVTYVNLDKDRKPTPIPK